MRRVWPLLLIWLALTGPVLAQVVPNHLDPNLREVIPNLTAVPSIRFLTTADYPPFNFRDKSGELVGFNIDLARALCADLAISCTVQAWPWDQAERALEDNQGDALIAGLAMSADTGARFDFSTLYLEFPGRFITAVAGGAPFDPASLEGKRVGVRRGSAHEAFVSRYLPRADLKPYADEIEALDALGRGELDAVFADGLRASFWLNTHVGCCEFRGEAFFRPDLFGEGLAIAVPAGHDQVRQVIDYGLARIKRSGVYDELYLRWFPVSFY
jgi:polar amino acid transport system substrate-binding protein